MKKQQSQKYLQKLVTNHSYFKYIYIRSYLTINSNSKLHKSSSIFLAAVLVAGVIAIASLSLAFAEGSDRYKEDKKYDKPGWKYNKAECSGNNFNIGQVTEFEAQIVDSWLR